jgi:hypothetical protein
MSWHGTITSISQLWRDLRMRAGLEVVLHGRGGGVREKPSAHVTHAFSLRSHLLATGHSISINVNARQLLRLLDLL